MLYFLIIAQILWTILVIQLAQKRFGGKFDYLLNPKTQNNEQYQAFTRNDYKDWNKKEFILVGIFLVPFRIILMMSYLITVFIVTKVVFYIKNVKDVNYMSEKMYKYTRFVVSTWAKIFMFGFGITYQQKFKDIDITKYDKIKRANIDHMNESIVVCNHINFFDFFPFFAYFDACTIAKSMVENIPFISFGAKISQVIFVNRDRQESRKDAMVKLRKRIELNKKGITPSQILIFPEGTVTNGKHLLKFYKGAFVNQLPVTVCCVSYESRFNPTMMLLELLDTIIGQIFQLRTKMTLSIINGAFEPKENTNVEEFTEEIRRMMAIENGLKLTQNDFKDSIKFEELYMKQKQFNIQSINLIINMSQFYDPFENRRKKQQNKKFFQIDQNDVKFEHEEMMQTKQQYKQKVDNICLKFINKIKSRVQETKNFKQHINKLQGNFEDLFKLLRVNIVLQSKNFLTEKFLLRFLQGHQEFFNFVKTRILKNVMQINGQQFIETFQSFLKYQSYFLKLLTINFDNNNNSNNKLNFSQFIGKQSDTNLIKNFMNFFKNIKDTFQLSQNFHVKQQFDTMRYNLEQLENVLFLQKNNYINQNSANIFYAYYDNSYFNNIYLDNVYCDVDLFVDKLLIILNIQANYQDKEKTMYVKQKIFETIFKSPYYFECLTNKNNIKIFQIFEKEFINVIKTDLKSQNVQKIQSNILLYIIIIFKKQQLELENFIENNNLLYDMQEFVLNKVKCFGFDSLYKSDIYSENLVQSIINKDSICSCLKNNYFKNSNKIMMDIYSLFFYSLRQSSSKLILTSLLKFIIKDNELLDILQKSILTSIAHKVNILDQKFNMILLEEILRLRLMIEEEQEILQDFQNWEIFFKRLYNYLYEEIQFYQDTFYKNQHELYKFLFKQISQILQFIMNLNDNKKFIQNLKKFDGSFDYDFIRDFYFFFDIEFRFNILRKSFSNQYNKVLNFKINRNFILEQGIELYQQLVNDSHMTGREKIMVTFIDETGNYEAGIDQGGLYKDFVGEFASYFIELDNRELYINPSVYHWVDYSPEIIYKVMGLLIARCFQEGFTINKILSRTFIRKIKGLPNYFKELKYYDKELYNRLKNLKNIENLEDLSLTFTVNEKDTNKEIELVHNGSNVIVNKQNLTRYLYLYADYKMNIQVQKQFENFQQGFQKIFDRSMLDFFSEREVQLLINGTEDFIDVEDWKHHTKIPQQQNFFGTLSNKYAEEFWQVVTEFDQIQRRKLLKFVTNYERPPLFGFKNLHPQFQIDFNSQLDINNLPTSSTCSNLLHVPIYRDKETLKQKLLLAIEMTKGHYIVQLITLNKFNSRIIMSYELETFKDFWYEMFCYQYPKTAFVMFVFWLIYLYIKVDCLVDFGWTLNHWIIGLTLVLQYLSEQNARTWISLGLLTLWFIRLGGFLFVTRILTKFEDKRYKAMSGKSKNKALYFLFQYEFQALIVVFTAIPLYFIFRRSDVLWRWTFFVGGAIALIGIIGEGVADHQLNEYKKKKSKQKKQDNGTNEQEMNEQNSNLIRNQKQDKYDNIFHEGLWRKSRHPNLFFELVTWVGFALMGLNDYTISFMSFLGPIILWALMYFITIPISEKSMAKSRKNWDDFVKDTNMFIPL